MFIGRYHQRRMESPRSRRRKGPRVMSACDTCRDPGACCTGFQLNGGEGAWPSFWVDDTPLAPLICMAAGWLPFVPVVRGPTIKGEDGSYWAVEKWGCLMLGEDGRCMDYENRPELCKRYEPKSDALCVEFDWAAFAQTFDNAKIAA
jgi:hypothetical protein